MLKRYLKASYNWKQNRKVFSGSFFIAAYVYTDGRKIMQSFWPHCNISAYA